MVGGVLEEVAEDPLETNLVDHSAAWSTSLHFDRNFGRRGARSDALGPLDEIEFLRVAVDGPGVEARQLEEVDDHRVESSNLLHEQVEGLSRAVAEFIATGGEHLNGGGHRGDRRPQLMADIGSETGLALDPRLHSVGHVVERTHESVEFGVVGVVEAGIEGALGDIARGVRYPGQWLE